MAEGAAFEAEIAAMSNGVISLVASMEMDPRRFSAAQLAVADIARVTRKLYPESEVQCYGSMATGMMGKNSDVRINALQTRPPRLNSCPVQVDVSIQITPDEIQNRNKRGTAMVNCLKKLTNALSQKHLHKHLGKNPMCRFANIEPILQPKIPILKVEHVNIQTGETVEIDISVYNTLAVHRSRLLAG